MFNTDPHFSCTNGNEWWQWWETILPLVSAASDLSLVLSAVDSSFLSSTYSVITSAVVTSSLPPGVGETSEVVELFGLEVEEEIELEGGELVEVVWLITASFSSPEDCFSECCSFTLSDFSWDFLNAFSLSLFLLSLIWSLSIVFFSSSSSLPWPGMRRLCSDFFILPILALYVGGGVGGDDHRHQKLPLT